MTPVSMAGSHQKKFFFSFLLSPLFLPASGTFPPLNAWKPLFPSFLSFFPFFLLLKGIRLARACCYHATGWTNDGQTNRHTDTRTDGRTDEASTLVFGHFRIKFALFSCLLAYSAPMIASSTISKPIQTKTNGERRKVTVNPNTWLLKRWSCKLAIIKVFRRGDILKDFFYLRKIL